MIPRILPPVLLRASSLLVGAVAFAVAPHAQVLIDDFDNGIGPGEFVFAGNEPGVLSTFDAGGGDFVAVFEADGDDYGGFTGWGQPIEGGAVDLTGFDRPVLEFDAAAEGTFTLEINFQNTGGGGEGEIRNALQFQLGPNNGETDLRTYRLPLSTFFTTNPASFEFDDVFQYVFTIVFAQGDGSSDGTETGIAIDNVRVVEGLGFSSAAVAEDFDSGDYSDTAGYFYFAGGEGIAASASPMTPDGSPFAFAGALDGDEFGGFAGFGTNVDNQPVDASGFETLNFFLKTNGPGVLEVNLQTVAGNGENEARERIRLDDTGGEFVPVSIPLRAMIQSGPNAPDFSQVVNYVFTFVELPGDGDPGTSEFEFAIDALGFGSSNPVAVGELPESFSAAPVAFPNPTAGAATVAFELASPQAVSVDVYDLLGRRVATLADGPQAAGAVRLAVPTGALAPGTYLVRVQTDEGPAATRLTVVR